MGEARQRKIARSAGRPWERDTPRSPLPRVLPWYMDPMCPALPPRQPLLVVAGPTDSLPRRPATYPEPRVHVVGGDDVDRLRQEIADRKPGEILLVSPGTGDGGTPMSIEALLSRPGVSAPASAERPAALPVVRRRSAAEVMMLLAALGLSSGQSAREDD